MKIIIVDRAKGSNGKGGYQARVYGEQPVIQCFAKSELEALRGLTENILEKNIKVGKIGNALNQI